LIWGEDSQGVKADIIIQAFPYLKSWKWPRNPAQHNNELDANKSLGKAEVVLYCCSLPGSQQSKECFHSLKPKYFKTEFSCLFPFS
jgi:hypothetical protein